MSTGMSRIVRKKVLNQIQATRNTTKIPVAGSTLQPRFKYELRVAGNYFLPDVRTNVVDTDTITVTAIGSAVPIVRVHGGNSEIITQGFKAPFQTDNNLELDLNLEVALVWDKLANTWRVQ